MLHQFRSHLILVLMRYTAAQYTTVPITGQHPLWLSHQRCGEGEERREAQTCSSRDYPAQLCAGPIVSTQWRSAVVPSQAKHSLLQMRQNQNLGKTLSDR